MHISFRIALQSDGLLARWVAAGGNFLVPVWSLHENGLQQDEAHLAPKLVVLERRQVGVTPRPSVNKPGDGQLH
ncbi:hypothetical protein EYF80_042996 [Liparis tanakae]|uniref:Uncharacterized protein n=1 Tax=Liparis tanakae TaxID=230148 RepID=A0A4Z2G0Z0_9TELE|nr:hypothetical protein EYF80_042996 [Liparis tanakae]